jgi:hypothetical protein
MPKTQVKFILPMPIGASKYMNKKTLEHRVHVDETRENLCVGGGGGVIN